MASSSVLGADDSDEESESAMTFMWCSHNKIAQKEEVAIYVQHTQSGGHDSN
jgi:hypothetical protein